MFFIIDFLKKRQAASLFLITFLIYSPILFNNFVGDDIEVFGGNTFYYSLKNIPRLFEKGCISNPKKVILLNGPYDIGSGGYSYRPITYLTYFIDYYFFRGKAYGSHFINILLHCINSVLVYWIVRQIFSTSALALFIGLLFSLHPIQSYAVSNCRGDLLAAMLVLFSFYFWIKFKQGGYVRRKYCFGAIMMYFFALFSKESSFPLPFVIILFDQFLASPRLALRQRGIYYLGFISILFFYLYIYFFVYPSASYSLNWLGGSLINHCLIMGYIWYIDLIKLLLPWTVKVVPGLYCPPVPGIVNIIEISIAFSVLITSLLVLFRSNQESMFFLLWGIIFYLPVSNLIPIVNPMADRYMYLPSIGLLIVLSVLLYKVFMPNFFDKFSKQISKILAIGIILICVTRTVFLNEDWKSNFDLGWACIRDYPAYYEGYAFVGKEYFDVGLFEKAKAYMEKSVLLGNKMPREVLLLAECYVQLKEFGMAETLLKQIIQNNPDYYEPYFYLGVIYYGQKKYWQALRVLEKTLVLNPKQPLGYILLMKVYLNLHKYEDAKIMLKKADKNLNAQERAFLYKLNFNKIQHFD